MAKRTPLKSTLGTSSPVTAAPVVNDQPADVVEPAVVAPVAPKKAQPAAKREAAEKAEVKKFGYYQNTEDQARVRGAFKHTGHLEGHSSLSAFVSSLLMREVERLEDEYNGGKPFEVVKPGEGRRGRPVE